LTLSRSGDNGISHSSAAEVGIGAMLEQQFHYFCPPCITRRLECGSLGEVVIDFEIIDICSGFEKDLDYLDMTSSSSRLQGPTTW
jgi:hypothetical protein